MGVCNCMYILLPEHFESPLNTVQAKKSIKMPLLVFHLPKSCTEAVILSNHHLYVVREKEMEHKGQQR